MKLNKLLLTILGGSLFFVSCQSDDDSGRGSSGVYDNGVLVLNQGGFGFGNASVSFVTDSLTIENNIYASNNGDAVLGDTGQDIGLKDDKAYIVLNASNAIEVVNRYTFAHIATIEDGLVNPRYIAFNNNKAYVTNWGDGGDTEDDYIAIIDLATNTITGNIPVAEGPERIIEENNKLYVSHYGGYGQGNTVSVISLSTNTVTATITTGDLPEFMVEENNKLYVLSEGISPAPWDPTIVETQAKLQVINLSNNQVATTLDFPVGIHPTNLVEEDGKLYFTAGSGIYSMSLNATSLPTTPLFSTTEQGVYGVYSFEVKDGKIYVGDAGNYTANGHVYIYSLTGTMEKNFEVGVIPAGFYFND
jgi:YVTN family beta-propeller protein